MTKLAVRLCILTCMLCPDREIVRLYIPKAKRAFEEVEGVVFSEKDISSVNGVIGINYDAYKDAANTPKCKQQYKSLVDYVDKHYHNLQIGKRYTWEEICRECPYRMVFLSSGTRDHGRVIDGIFEGASKLEEQAPVLNAALARGVRINVWKWTCGDENKGVYIYAFGIGC